MDIVITKGESGDRIAVERADGSAASFGLPHKGPVPHDIVHYFVERALAAQDGFWGKVEAGIDPQEIGTMAKAAGHASAKRARQPDPGFVEIIRIERIVEAFEADLWCGGEGHEGVRDMAAAGCAHSRVAPLDLDGHLIDRVREEIADFREHWAALPQGSSVQVEWIGRP